MRALQIDQSDVCTLGFEICAYCFDYDPSERVTDPNDFMMLWLSVAPSMNTKVKNFRADSGYQTCLKNAQDFGEGVGQVGYMSAYDPLPSTSSIVLRDNVSHEPRIPRVCVLLSQAADEQSQMNELLLLLGMLRSRCSRTSRFWRSNPSRRR